MFAGEVKPRHEADLGFRIGGKIVARTVDVGARVKKGQVLARLDPADVGLQAEAAKAQVAATETEFRFAQAEYERYQNLHREKFISASALDAKRNTLDANRAKYEQAQGEPRRLAEPGELRDARRQRRRRRHRGQRRAGPGRDRRAAGRAPRARGRARGRDQRAGEPHRRSEGARSELVVVAVGAARASTYRGRVREVAPAVDPTTRTFAVRVTIEDADASVQWGMTANVGVHRHGQRATRRCCR